MRRNEFEIIDKQAIFDLLNECDYGVLSLLDHGLPIYTKMVEKTVVMKFSITDFSMKLKLGQQLSNERLQNLIKQLEERGTTLDMLTANAMKRLCHA